MNSVQIDDWISALLHKNDSYQTPIVIEPYRKKGDIEINKQNDLVKSRMLSNILENENLAANELRSIYTSFRRIIEEDDRYSDAESIKLLKRKNEKTSNNKRITDEHITEVFDSIVNVLNIKVNTAIFDLSKFDDFQNIKNYIIYKLELISTRYPAYTGLSLTRKSNIPKFIALVLEDRSHITYKIRQAIFYVLLDMKSVYEPDKNLLINNISREIELRKIQFNLLKLDTIDLLPPPIFDVKIFLKNERGEVFGIEKLSSGEKQLVYSINSVLYHLKNIASVFKNNNNQIVKYSRVNLMLDEVELYFHPEMQRKYISFLLAGLNRVKLNNILAINICFVTHSPYMLSDIPDSSILRLEDGLPVKGSFKTFGSNIHDLLANDFFMKEGYMGEFAKKNIEEVILFLNYSKLKGNYLKNIQKEKYEADLIDIIKKLGVYSGNISESNLSSVISMIDFDIEKYKNIIDIIGEPVLKSKLSEMYANLFPEVNKEELIRDKIRKLSAEIGFDVEFKKN